MFYLALVLIVIAIGSFAWNGYMEKKEEQRKASLNELNEQVNRYNRSVNEEFEINGVDSQENWHPDQPF